MFINLVGSQTLWLWVSHGVSESVTVLVS